MLELIKALGFGLLGLAVLIGCAYACSTSRRDINWRLVLAGLGLQIVVALLILKVPFGRTMFDTIARGFIKLLDFVAVGTHFIFGDFTDISRFGFSIALHVLPMIIFFAALTAVLYHVGIMQRIVAGMAWLILRVMPLSGAEVTSVCANIFIGQSEAPLTVKPYIAGMTRSELFTLMLGGMATIAGSVMGAYVGMLGGDDPLQRQFYAKHLLTASLMAAPAALALSKILVPETTTPQTLGRVSIDRHKTSANVIDAAALGAMDGVYLALNIGAMLLAFTALIAMMNAPLEWLGEQIWSGGGSLNAWLSEAAARPVSLSMETILGWLFAPVAWIIGVPWQDAMLVGSFIGQKTVLNEFLAYLNMSQRLQELLPQSRLIATYALCGFANFSSLAIQIGAIGGLAPERRAEVASLGLRAILGGTLATLMTATIAGVLNEV